MEEIQIGEYVRTKKGHIFKLDKYWLFNDKYKEIDIAKHSFNRIDILTIGDLVKTNQGSIFEINEIKVSSFDSVIFIDDYKMELHENDIKSIVTKEQFEEKEYIIKE